MNNMKEIIFYLSICLSILAVSAYVENDSWVTIELHHKLAPGADEGEFTFRGNITIPSLSNGLAQTEQNTLTADELDLLNKHLRPCYVIYYILCYANMKQCPRHFKHSSFGHGQLSFFDTFPHMLIFNYFASQTFLINFRYTKNTKLWPSPILPQLIYCHEIPFEIIYSFTKLAKSNGLYKLKAVVIYSDGSRSHFLTSNKACSFIKSKLSDVLWVSIDYNSYVTGITQTLPGFGSESDCSEIDQFSETELNTDVVVRHMELAPVPDTTSFVQKLERERESREKGEVKDNRGFFAKYWMYIVPVVILVLISGATNPEGGSQ